MTGQPSAAEQAQMARPWVESVLRRYQAEQDAEFTDHLVDLLAGREDALVHLDEPYSLAQPGTVKLLRYWSQADLLELAIRRRNDADDATRRAHIAGRVLTAAACRLEDHAVDCVGEVAWTTGVRS